LNPGYGVAYFSRGRAYAQAGDKQQAEQDLEMANSLGKKIKDEFMKEHNIPWTGEVHLEE
jgi:hypothetical protein